MDVFRHDSRAGESWYFKLLLLTAVYWIFPVSLLNTLLAWLQGNEERVTWRKPEFSSGNFYKTVAKTFTNKFKHLTIEMTENIHMRSASKVYDCIAGVCSVPHMLYVDLHSQWWSGHAAQRQVRQTRVFRDTCSTTSGLSSYTSSPASKQVVWNESQWYWQVQQSHLPHHVRHLPPDVLDDLSESGWRCSRGHSLPVICIITLSGII